MVDAYIAIVVVACILALANWRTAVLACLVIDVIRDPIRKLTEDQPVWITLAGNLPWGVILLSAYGREQRELLAIFSRYPKLKPALLCLIIALAPGFFLSSMLYRNGILLALVGAASYIGPLIGLGLGYLFVREEQAIPRLLFTYIAVNSVMLIGVPLEFAEYDIPGLGGIKMDWIRYQEGYIVDLISGFYRSPDVMGLHAAHVAIFATILAARARGGAGVAWLAIAGWGTLGLLLCGRRKMVAIPLVFITAYLALSYWRGASRRASTMIVLTLVLFGGFSSALLFATKPEWFEYTAYASTIVSDAPDRISTNILGGALETMQRTGLLGAGLGTGTQGRYYLNVQSGRAARGWQEDGFSRLFLELGLPGVILAMVSALCVATSFEASSKLIPRDHRLRDLQLMLVAVIIGDMASFIIAHQHFSGDPASALLVMLLAGAVLGMPRVYAGSITTSTVK